MKLHGVLVLFRHSRRRRHGRGQQWTSTVADDAPTASSARAAEYLYKLLPQRLRSGANAAQVVQRVLVLAALGQVCVRFSLLATSPSSGLRACLPAPSTSPRLPPRARVRDRLRCRPDPVELVRVAPPGERGIQGPTLRDRPGSGTWPPAGVSTRRAARPHPRARRPG